MSTDVRGPSHTISRSGRIAAGLLASIAWLGLARYGIAEVSNQGGDGLAALWTNAAYLTDLSNLLLAVVMTGIAAGSRALSRPAIVGWAVTAIATVGVGFWMIGGTLILGNSALEDVLLHAVTPWAAVLFWLIWVPKGELRRSHALAWMAWPIAYWTYAMTRGLLTGTFAYSFMDPGPNGAVAVAVMIGKLIAVHAAWVLILMVLDQMMVRGRGLGNGGRFSS